MNILFEYVSFLSLNTLRYLLLPSIVFVLFIVVTRIFSFGVDRFLVNVNIEYVWSVAVFGGLLAIVVYFYLVFKRNLLKGIYQERS